MFLSLTGSATQPISPIWLRGRARLENGVIRLDRAAAEEFDLYAEMDGLLDRLTNVRDPHDALAFVRAYGLLRTRPEVEDLAEPFEEWEAMASLLRDAFHLYAALASPVLDGDAARHLKGRIRRIAVMLEAELTIDLDEVGREDLRGIAADVLARLLNAGLGEATIGVASATWLDPAPGPPGVFLFSPRVSNPMEAAFYQIANVIVNRLEMRACEECGALFPVRDQRQRFHPRCGNRNRQRRFAEKRSAGVENPHLGSKQPKKGGKR
jgi:hypothetical protein